ncbi:MAG: hypothetical protein N2511_02005 [Thermodesulfovibrionales bacterium]|nr:hypothetical protein [Thermodesulfovibrionales bacterium]
MGRLKEVYYFDHCDYGFIKMMWGSVSTKMRKVSFRNFFVGGNQIIVIAQTRFEEF